MTHTPTAQLGETREASDNLSVSEQVHSEIASPFKRALGYLCVLAALTLVGTAAHAQVLEEIVVTAQKREQSLQDVGISVSAFSGEDLAALGVQSQENLALQTPNLNYLNNGPSPFYRIRGDGVNVFNDTAETPAGFYIDEVYYSASALQRLQIYDVERAEVLRGPQGILFGRNTTAGLVHFISRKPTDEFEAYLEAEGGSFSHRIVEGAISGPLGEAVRARLSFKYNEDDGWQENQAAVGGDEFAVTDVITVRGQIDFDLGQNANLLVKASYYEDDASNQLYGYQGALDPVTFAPCSDARIVANECVNINGFPTGDPDPERGFTEQAELRNELEFAEVMATLQWQLTDSIELVSITAYLDYDRVLDEEFDATPVGGVLGNVTPSYAVGGDQLSQEIRLHGSYADRLTWVAGLYYIDDERFSTSTIFEFFGPPPPSDTEANVKTESWAVFGHGEYAVTETVTLLGGVRYTEDDKDLDLTLLLGPGGSFNTKDDEVTWKAGLNWLPRDELLLYASAQTGFKSADFNTTLLFGDASAAAPTEPETNITYEGGVKWTFLDGRARLNAAVFYNDVTDKQATVQLSVGGIPTTRFFNFGDAEVLGAEIELETQLTDRLFVQVGVGLLDTEIKADPTTTFASGPAFDETPVDGKELPGAPSVSVNGLVRYDFPTTNSGIFSLQTEFSYQDEQFFTLDNVARDGEDSYGLVNLRVLWESADAKYYGQAFVENVGDKEYAAYSFTLGGVDQRDILWGRPLWWGVRAGVRF